MSQRDESDHKQEDRTDLLIENDVPGEIDSFEEQLEKTLAETEEAFLHAPGTDAGARQKWHMAREKIAGLQPIPWFIWRLSNFVFSRQDRSQPIPEGLVFGLRRLLFAAASDSLLGAGEKINSTRKALSVLEPDTIPAVAILYSTSRKLASQSNERIWRPILDDALLRARIGATLGSVSPSLSIGQGLLAGFASRIGLAILIATSNEETARKALELLATGERISDVGERLYGTPPLFVSAMLLSAGGCGSDSAIGIAAFGGESSEPSFENGDQSAWYNAFVVAERIRQGQVGDISEEMWAALGFENSTERTELLEEAKRITRRGHGWGWLVSTP